MTYRVPDEKNQKLDHDMAGLTDQAGGINVSGGEAVERAHQAWQESMLRQMDRLRAEIQATQPGRLAVNCGGRLINQQIQLSYWGTEIGISWPELKICSLSDGAECSIYDAGMLLYYLREADGTPMAERWVGYRELPGGNFYSQAFQGYAGDRLARIFGEHLDLYTQSAQALGGTSLTGLPGMAYSFQPLPRIRLAAILYPGDEEFTARASVLFDAAAGHYMTIDGLALLGSGLVGRMINQRYS